jgi:hypothetical protein
VALVGMRGRGGRDGGGRQESAIAGGPDPATSNGATVANGLGDHDPDIRPAPVASGNGRSNGHAPPPPGRTPGAPATGPPVAANGNGSAAARGPADPPAVGARPRRSEPEHDLSPRTSHDLSPRASHENAMRRARELRERQRAGTDDRAHRS